MYNRQRTYHIYNWSVVTWTIFGPGVKSVDYIFIKLPQY